MRNTNKLRDKQTSRSQYEFPFNSTLNQVWWSLEKFNHFTEALEELWSWFNDTAKNCDANCDHWWQRQTIGAPSCPPTSPSSAVLLHNNKVAPLTLRLSFRSGSVLPGKKNVNTGHFKRFNKHSPPVLSFFPGRALCKEIAEWGCAYQHHFCCTSISGSCLLLQVQNLFSRAVNQTRCSSLSPVWRFPCAPCHGRVLAAQLLHARQWHSMPLQ